MASSSDWIVTYHDAAVVEYAALRDSRQRKGVLTIATFLRELGPKLVEPHSKALAGTRKLRELRPGGGRVPVRPLYAQVSARQFVVFAIAPESQVDPRGFRSAVQRAQDRAKADFDLDV